MELPARCNPYSVLRTRYVVVPFAKRNDNDSFARISELLRR